MPPDQAIRGYEDGGPVIVESATRPYHVSVRPLRESPQPTWMYLWSTRTNEKSSPCPFDPGGYEAEALLTRTGALKTTPW